MNKVIKTEDSWPSDAKCPSTGGLPWEKLCQSHSLLPPQSSASGIGDSHEMGCLPSLTTNLCIYVTAPWKNNESRGQQENFSKRFQGQACQNHSKLLLPRKLHLHRVYPRGWSYTQISCFCISFTFCSFSLYVFFLNCTVFP